MANDIEKATNAWEKLIDSIQSSLDPQAQVYSYWNASTRPDGRSFLQCRPTTLQTNVLHDVLGSSRVVTGQTHVMASVTYQIGQPPASSASLCNAGNITVTLDDCRAAAASRHRDTTSTSRLLLYQSLLERTLIDAANLTALVLQEHVAALSLQVTVHVLYDDGNVLDAALLAAVAALQSIRRPVLVCRDGVYHVDASNHKAGTTESSLGRKLFARVPISLTMILLPSMADATALQQLLLDPTTAEELVAPSKFVLLVDAVQPDILVGIDFLTIDAQAHVSPAVMALAGRLVRARAEEIRDLLSIHVEE